MNQFVRIAVNMPGLRGEYDYHLPASLEGSLSPGHLVVVPFGKQTVQGVVLELLTQPSTAETRPVIDLVDPQPVLTPAQISLARIMADQTLNPLPAVLELMLPSGLAQQADTLYSLTSRQPSADQLKTPVAARLLRLLGERSPLRGRQIDRHFARVDWRKTARQLINCGVIESKSILPPTSVRPKTVRTVQLAVPLSQAQAAMPDLGRSETSRARRQVALQYLMDEPTEANVAWVYAASGCSLSDLQALAERELIVLRENEIWRDPLEKVARLLEEHTPPPALTADQQAAWDAICPALAGNAPAGTAPSRPFLLHGVTGSGKTEIYLRAAKEVVQRGRQAIILVPEIAITPQTVRRFLLRFPGQVGLIHSRLSAGERYDTWRRARLGLLQVIIGPRSALFAPLPSLGLVVADECHDPSYSQSEPPFYNAVSAAQEVARICGAVCILGSSTPSLVQRYQAGIGASIYLGLPRRILNPDLPPVQVVDMRAELVAGNRGIFSQALVAALKHTLDHEQQAILFLNRRGTDTYVFCRDCGQVLKCPRCELPLAHHTAAPADSLRCHHCDYQRGLPKTCPACGGARIRAYGLGSEKVEAEVRALFPQARTLRWDRDTTGRKDAHEIILGHFAAHRADILVGTQMLAKGLDLPLVTLVGIVLADVGMNLPDPFAAERSFDVLTQVAGRAGRSALGGRVVLQTFAPEHPVIQAASRHDYAAFYALELEERKHLGYPPFSRLLRLEYRHANALQAEEAARRLAEQLSQRIQAGAHHQTNLIGPVPCFFSRLGGLVRWQIVVRSPDPAALVRGLKLTDWRVEMDPLSLL